MPGGLQTQGLVRGDHSADRGGGEPAAFVFLFALQSPFFAAFPQVDRTESEAPPLSALRSLLMPPSTVSPGFYDHCFSVDWGRVVFGGDIVCEDPSKLFAFSDIMVLGSDRLVSNGRLVPFDEFLEALPPRPQPAPLATTPRPRPIPIEGLPKYKWLKRYLPNDEPQPNDLGATSSSAARSGRDVVPLDDEEAEELEYLQREWHQSMDAMPESFKRGLLGGKWTKSILGGSQMQCVVIGEAKA